MDKLKLAALGERLKSGSERLKIGGAEMGRKVSGKMKEILQVQSQESKIVDEATSDSLEEPNWGLNLRICALLNSDELNGSEVMKAIKKKIASKNTVSQKLSLDLLEACAMNCDKVFSEVASEKVLDEMVRMIDNRQTYYSNKQRALQLIKAWGESDDLAYLPVFNQTYMNLKARKTLITAQGDGTSASIFSYLDPGISEEAVDLPEGYPSPYMDQQNTDHDALAYHGGALSVEEKKEILVITRNSMEILSSMLNSETQQKPIKVDSNYNRKICKSGGMVTSRLILRTNGTNFGVGKNNSFRSGLFFPTKLGCLLPKQAGKTTVPHPTVIITVHPNRPLSSQITTIWGRAVTYQDDLILSMLEKCKESQPVIQRIIESIGDDEPLLFEALNLHDELQQVLSKYEELETAVPSPDAQVLGDCGTSDHHKGDPINEKEAGERSTPRGGNSEAIGDHKDKEND